MDFKNEKADEIITEIESEEPDRRIQALEDEIKEIKGSIKKLLLDLREQMTNIENPFRDLKGLTTLIQAPAVSKEEEEEETEEETEEEKKAEEERKESAAIPLPEKLPEKMGEKRGIGITEEEFMDPFLVSNLVDWTREMLSKYGRRRFEEILELSLLLGYASEKIVKIIHKISHLCPDTMVSIKEINTNDLVADLHKLHTIVKGDAAEGRILDILLRRD